jgi:hypothetical protein
MAGRKEIWLRGNQRLMLAGMAVPFLIALGSALFMGLSFFAGSFSTTLFVLGIVAIVAALIMGGLIAWVGRLPRVAYDALERKVVLYLPGPTPYRIPLDIVECFFLGSGITQLPGQSTRDVQTKNIVVRLAERADDWHRRDLTLSIGKWCEGYITIRGLYCEPFDVETIKRLNTLLHQAQHTVAKPLPTQPKLVQGQLLTTGVEASQDAQP